MWCHDHLGNRFKSKKAMCKHYKVAYSTFNGRLAKGLTLEEALTVESSWSVTHPSPKRELYVCKTGCCFDHLGNYYSSLNKMTGAWEIKISTFLYRMEVGWSVEAALTTNSPVVVPPVDDSVVWVFGTPYPSYYAVDVAFGFSKGASSKHGDNIEEWLLSMGACKVDGVDYKSVSEACRQYEISENVVRDRMKNGASLNDALKLPVGPSYNCKECTDHLGNTYNSIEEMVRFYRIDYSAYKKRRANGWSKERALTTPVRARKRTVPNIPMDGRGV